MQLHGRKNASEHKVFPGSNHSRVVETITRRLIATSKIRAAETNWIGTKPSGCQKRHGHSVHRVVVAKRMANWRKAG